MTMTKEKRIENLKLSIKLFELVNKGIPTIMIGTPHDQEFIESYAKAKEKYEKNKKELKMLEEDSAE